MVERPLLSSPIPPALALTIVMWLVLALFLTTHQRLFAAPDSRNQSRQLDLLERLYPAQLPIQPPRSTRLADVDPESPKTPQVALDDAATTTLIEPIRRIGQELSTTLSLVAIPATTTTLSLVPRRSSETTTQTLPRVELRQPVVRPALPSRLSRPVAKEKVAQEPSSRSTIYLESLPMSKSPEPPPASISIAVNTAPVAELMEKLKIDPRRARLIVEFRQSYGPFRRPDDLAQVNGITDAMLVLWEERGLLVFD